VLDEMAVMLERVFEERPSTDWRAPELGFRGERQTCRKLGNLMENAKWAERRCGSPVRRASVDGGRRRGRRPRPRADQRRCLERGRMTTPRRARWALYRGRTDSAYGGGSLADSWGGLKVVLNCPRPSSISLADSAC
jgi:hypothetical protein